MPFEAIVWVNSGWQHRPEGWILGEDGNYMLNNVSARPRPGNISTTYVTMDEAWWGSFETRGFNISKTNGGSLVGVGDDTVYENFKIYIPVENIAE